MTSGQAFFDGLAALVEASFPTRCANCGTVYPDAHSFIADTLPISPDRTGLKQGVDERDLTIVEAFRNCANSPNMSITSSCNLAGDGSSVVAIT